MFTILVVEDDAPLQRMMSAFLGLNGFSVVGAANGEEALNAIDRVMPDLVIADVMMPVMDGWELTRELRRCYPRLPIMLVTARDTIEDKRTGFTSGADDYLTKPVDLDELLLHVQFFLLFKLLSSPMQIFTRRQLMDEIWGMDAQSDERTVDVHIKRLREKCEIFPDFSIVTVRGLGYKAVKNG